MRVANLLACDTPACADVDLSRFSAPPWIEPEEVELVLIAESPPLDPADWFYAGEDALYARTTLEAFRAAGEHVTTLDDILALGVYLTTAVKCAKREPAVSTATIAACAPLLEQELDLFPFARALLLMGDTAIRAVNAIAKRHGERRPVPAGATYRIRGGDYRFRGLRVFPSYLQAGPAWFIEASKRRMIAEDIATALAFVRGASTPRGG